MPWLDLSFWSSGRKDTLSLLKYTRPRLALLHRDKSSQFQHLFFHLQEYRRSWKIRPSFCSRSPLGTYCFRALDLPFQRIDEWCLCAFRAWCLNWSPLSSHCICNSWSFHVAQCLVLSSSYRLLYQYAEERWSHLWAPLSSEYECALKRLHLVVGTVRATWCN